MGGNSIAFTTDHARFQQLLRGVSQQNWENWRKAGCRLEQVLFATFDALAVLLEHTIRLSVVPAAEEF